MTQILVTGGGGRLSRALRQAAPKPSEWIFCDRKALDICDHRRFASLLRIYSPHYVINCAAMTDVDACERDPARACSINGEAVGSLADACAEAHVTFVHVSTDFVFGRQDRDTPYKETDTPEPANWYGLSKLDGEEQTIRSGSAHIIIRTAWLYGAPPERAFPESLLKRMAIGEKVSVVSDRIGSPTYAPDLAEAIIGLLESDFRGLLHFANSGEPTSRYEVMRAIQHETGMMSYEVSALKAAEWTRDIAPRPAYTALDISRYIEVTGKTPRHWQEACEDFAARYMVSA